jgi:hypothetical protein
MSIAVACRCGSTYNLKDEYAGTVITCPKCGGSINVGLVARAPQGDPIFGRDKFLLRQKHMAISEKYYVWDEYGQTILFIERPAHLGRNLLAGLAGAAAGFLFFLFFAMLANVVSSKDISALLALMGVVGGFVSFLVVAIALSQKRHITFFRDDTKQERLLEIRQDAKFQPITATYTVLGPNGELLANLHKNYLYNMFRKRWYCYGPDGSIICMAMEDSLILSLLRRFIGPLFGVLRTNFIIVQGREENVLGQFNRNFSILDRYVLDMSRDYTRSIDRRIALAIGVMLDTGERR